MANLFFFFVSLASCAVAAASDHAVCAFPDGSRLNYSRHALVWVEEPSWLFARLGYGPAVPDIAADEDTVVCKFASAPGHEGHEYGARQLAVIDRSAPADVKAFGANQPNGFDRREHSLARPRDKVKSQKFQLANYACRPVFITEKVDGSTSNSYHSQIYVRVTSDTLIAVSLSGGKPEEPQSPSSQCMPMTKFVEYMTYWPNLVVCNLEDAQIDFVVEYANAAPSLWASPAAFVATVLLVAQFVELA